MEYLLSPGTWYLIHLNYFLETNNKHILSTLWCHNVQKIAFTWALFCVAAKVQLSKYCFKMYSLTIFIALWMWHGIVLCKLNWHSIGHGFHVLPCHKVQSPFFFYNLLKGFLSSSKKNIQHSHLASYKTSRNIIIAFFNLRFSPWKLEFFSPNT